MVESFLDQPVAVRLTGSYSHIQNLASKVTLSGEPVVNRLFGMRPGNPPPAPSQFVFEVQILPHSFLAFHGEH